MYVRNKYLVTSIYIFKLVSVIFCYRVSEISNYFVYHAQYIYIGKFPTVTAQILS